MGNAVVNGLYAESPSSDRCTSRFHAPCFAAWTDATRDFAYRIAVPAGVAVELRPRIYLESGAILNLDPIMVDIVAGETIVQDFEVSSPEGSITGTLEMPGTEVPYGHLTFVQGTAQKFVDFESDGPYEIPGLPDGDYTLFANSIFGETSSLQTFGHPNASITPGRSVSITGQELSLVPGPNVIETTATDDNENTVTDTRTVFLDSESSPPVLSWTPADGTTTSEADIVVNGFADDAEGIASITVEGVEVEFTSTGNSAQPNEVSFTTNMMLVSGENAIDVVATNLSDLQTSQTHIVTLLDENSPPVADAGDDIVQPCSGPCEEECGTLVTLDGSGSSDPDGDDLTYTWTGSFPEGNGTVTGETVDVTLPLGTHEITLTVDDGSEQPTDTVMVTVELEVVGLSPPLARLVPAGQVAPLPRRPFNPSSTLPLRFSLYCNGYALSGSDITAPEIVALVGDRAGAIDLSQIDLDSGKSNGDTLFFRHDDGQWIYNLNTKILPAGNVYTITIRMPGELDYQARFSLREGRSTSPRRSSRKR